jgi:hypothetical protein
MTASVRFVLQQQSFPTYKSSLNRIPSTPACACTSLHAAQPRA